MNAGYAATRLANNEPGQTTASASSTTTDDKDMDVASQPYDTGPTVPGHPIGGVLEVRPVGRYEWEQIVRRARFSGVVGGTGRVGKDGRRPTRGGLAAVTVKAVALALASYADDKGRQVRPGDATLAVDLECGIRTVQSVRALLVDLGLLQQVRMASRGRAEEYRLTLPVDLLELLEVLTPAQHQLAARTVREARRGPRGVARQSDESAMGGSAGHTQPTRWVAPPDTPNPRSRDPLGGSAGPPQHAMGGSAGAQWVAPPEPRTDHDRTSSTTTDQSRIDVRTAVTVSREPAAVEDQISREGAKARPPAGRPPDNRPHSRPAVRPSWREDTAAVAAPEPPSYSGRAAFAAARATLAAKRAAAHADAPPRAPGDAWAALVAATEPEAALTTRRPSNG